MKLGCDAGMASGRSISSCHFLLFRFDAKWGFKPNEGETWICQVDGEETHVLYGGLSWFTGVWRSPSGKVYVSSADSEVLVNPDPAPRAAPWRTDELEGTLVGVWGLDDKFVLTWGLDGDKTVMYRYDGSKWTEIESPGEVYGVHGISRDLVMAVGRDGLVARWDGKRWKKQVTPARGPLSSVWVESEDEMYAVGRNRQMLQGSVHGWAELLEGPGAMLAVAKWKGEVWVGATEDGLMKLKRNKLVSVKPNLKVSRIDARWDLLVSGQNAVASTSDGKDYDGNLAADMLDLLKDKKPAWTR